MITEEKHKIERHISEPWTTPDHWHPAWLDSDYVDDTQTQEATALTAGLIADEEGVESDDAIPDHILDHVDDTFRDPFALDAYNESCWSNIYAGDFRYLTAPRSYPPPCPWCGGRFRHNPLCDELRQSWEPTLPFGKHKGKPLSAVPLDYLEWLVNKPGIDQELHDAARSHLNKRRSSNGPQRD